MPVWNTLRIIPVALLATPYGTDPGPLGLWQSETAVGGDADGLGATGPIYEISEPIPRTNITHRIGNAAPNAAQLALLVGAGTDVNGYVLCENINSGLAGCLVKNWDRALGTSTSPQMAMLAAAGLTMTSTV